VQAQKSAPSVEQGNDPLRQVPRRRHDEERGDRRDRPSYEIGLEPLGQETRSQAEIEHGTMNVTIATITLDINAANISRDLASIA